MKPDFITECPAQYELRRLVRDAITFSGLTQVAVARTAEVTPKHLSQMLNARVRMSLTQAERILAATGCQLELKTRKVRRDERA